MTDLNKKYPTHADKNKRIRQLESQLARAAHGPAVEKLEKRYDENLSALRKANGRLGGLIRHNNEQWEEIQCLKCDIRELTARNDEMTTRLMKLDEPIPYTVTTTDGENASYDI